MTPYYEDGLVTLYHGDCLGILRDLDSTILAAVVTDPPYASGARTEAAKNSSGAMLRGERWAAKPIENDQMTTTGFIWLIRETCYAVRPMLTEGGSVLAFIDWRQWPNLVGAIETTNLRVNGMVVWDKQSYGLGNGFRAQHELVCGRRRDAASRSELGHPRYRYRIRGALLRGHRQAPRPRHPVWGCRMTPSGIYPDNSGGHFYYAVRYTPGTILADRFPGIPRGRFKTAEEAENIRQHCPNAEHMEVVDVREVGR